MFKRFYNKKRITTQVKKKTFMSKDFVVTFIKPLY